LPHHILLALYQVSTLILDSYPAGGCTTTREALELSKVVVTLPARLLGGRWTYAYYQRLQDSTLNEHVIAMTPEDYIEKAVALGRDEALRTEMERRIQASLHHLYRSWDAVKSWEKALRTISPVEKRETCDAW
jgi:protein O-GlcNAc transferase